MEDAAKLAEIVLPAQAGMIPGLRREGVENVSTPRASGDDPHFTYSEKVSNEYSPRKRG